MASYVLPICLFVVVLTIVYAAPADEKPLECPAGEKYYKCELQICDKTCNDLKRPPPCPSIAPGCYKPACLCDNDTLRNSEGKCVPINQCCCPPNEKFYKCQIEMCFTTCAHLKQPPPCPSIDPSCYDPACLCDYGDLRNSAGKCVPENKCS